MTTAGVFRISREDLQPEKEGGNGRIVDKNWRIGHWVSKHDGTPGSLDDFSETS
jgi:hypothetical protein